MVDLIASSGGGPLIGNAPLIVTIRGEVLDLLDGEPSSAKLLGYPSISVMPHVAYVCDASAAEPHRRECGEAVRVLHGNRPDHPRNMRDV